jgi:uncharacterized membrane protein
MLTFYSVGAGLIGSILSGLISKYNILIIVKKIKTFKKVILIELFLSIIFSVAFILSLIT